MNFNNKQNINTQKTIFKGHNGSSLLGSVFDNPKNLIHETAFFRDIKPLEHTVDFFQNRGAKNISVADVGCSTGEESWTLAMLFEKLMVKITGLDISKGAVNRASNEIFPLREPLDEKMLIYRVNNPNNIESFADKHLYFGLEKATNEKEKSQIETFDRFFRQTFDKEKIINFKENHLLPFEDMLYKEKSEKYFEIMPDKKDICTFAEGNIMNLSNKVEKNSQDMVVFKNSIYHLTMDINPIGRKMKNANEIVSNLEKIFGEIHQALKENGLFVIGSQITDVKTSRLAGGILEKMRFTPSFKEEGIVTVWKKAPNSN